MVLAKQVQRVAKTVSPTLVVPQLYESKGPARDQRDPAEGRSDYAALQKHGYAACLAWN
jgi:hypothetical protein